MARYTPKTLFVQTSRDLLTGEMQTRIIGATAARDVEVGIIHQHVCGDAHKFAEIVCDLYNKASEEVRRDNHLARLRPPVTGPKIRRLKVTKTKKEKAHA